MRQAAKVWAGKNGNDRTVWELIAEQARFTSSKNSNNMSPDSYPEDKANDPTDDFVEIDDDGDLPF